MFKNLIGLIVCCSFLYSCSNQVPNNSGYGNANNLSSQDEVSGESRGDAFGVRNTCNVWFNFFLPACRK